MSFKVKGHWVSSLLLLFTLASSLQAATVKIILSAINDDSIKQADEIEIGKFISLPSDAALSIGTFVSDPDSNRAAIAALLSSGSAVTNLTNSSNFLTFGTLPHDDFDPDGVLSFEFEVAAFSGKSIFLVAYNNSNSTAATQVGVYRFYNYDSIEGMYLPARFKAAGELDDETAVSLLQETGDIND